MASATAQPTPLSPDQFGNPIGQPAGTGNVATSAGPDFSAADLATLRHVLDAIRAARADTKNSDPGVAKAANRRLLALFGYLTGFLDSRGVMPEPTVEPGFGTLFGADAQPDQETALDEIESMLESAVNMSGTRSLRKAAGAFLTGLGTVIIALSPL